MNNSESRLFIMQQEDSVRCPIASFELFLQHLNPKVNHLFQMVKHNINLRFDKVWYNPWPLGKNTIADMLKVISERTQCSKIYTSHCLRHITANAMKKGGANLQQIVQQMKKI